MSDQELDQELDQVDQELEQEVNEDVSETDSEPEYTEVELEALERGWKPDGVEGKRKLSAEEYLDRQPLYDRLHKTDKLVKQQQQQLEAFQKHLDGVSERMYQKALREIKAERLEAVKDADVERVEQLDKELDELNQERNKTVEKEEQQGYSQEALQKFAAWENNPANSWYRNDPDESQKANDFAMQYMNSELARLGELPDPDDVIKYVEFKMGKSVPEKSMSRPKQAVEGGSRKPPPKQKGFDFKDLKSDEDRMAAQNIIRSGVAKESYFKSLEESGYFD